MPSIHEGETAAKGPEGFYGFFDPMHAAFSDIGITLLDAIAEGDRVCVRRFCSVKNTDDGSGVPATNKTQTSRILRTQSGRHRNGLEYEQ